MPCTKCGLQLGADALFCQRCGQPVAEATAAPSAATTPAQETPEPPAPAATSEPPDAAEPPSPFDTPAHPYGAEPPSPFATPAQPYGAEPPSPYATPAQPYGAPQPPAPGTWPPPPPYGQAPPPPGPHQLGYGQPPWTQPVPPEATNKLSTAAFICGGLAVLFLPIILGRGHHLRQPREEAQGNPSRCRDGRGHHRYRPGFDLRLLGAAALCLWLVGRQIMRPDGRPVPDGAGVATPPCLSSYFLICRARRGGPRLPSWRTYVDRHAA
jgi:hypothetical protein